MTTMTRLIVSIIVNCTSRTDARVVCERSDIRSTRTAGGSDCVELRHQCFDIVNNGDRIGAGRFLDRDTLRPLVAEPRAEPGRSAPS